jgi:hypothetical protein
VALRFDPSEQFEVLDLVGADDGARKFGFPEQFISGLLEVLTTNDSGPLTRIRVTLVEAEHHAIDSSQGIRRGRSGCWKKAAKGFQRWQGLARGLVSTVCRNLNARTGAPFPRAATARPLHE